MLFFEISHIKIQYEIKMRRNLHICNTQTKIFATDFEIQTFFKFFVALKITALPELEHTHCRFTWVYSMSIRKIIL